MRNCKHRCGRIAVFVVVGVAVAGLVTMTLWNWLTPDLFGWKPIGYLQALGILVLSKILFGGLRGHCGHGFMHDRMAARLDQLTPEERERFKAGMRSKWCGCGSSGSAEEPAKDTGDKD
ncbi:MAG TPA: hypothetical protein VF811_03115 [Parasulfuritortus sp.]